MDPHEQERPIDLIEGPDGMIYVGTIPTKGRLGGALVRINPDDLTSTVWRNVIEQQSILYLVSLPASGQIFGVSSITGGTSAVPSEKEAYVFFWDCRQEKVVFRGQPLGPTSSYGPIARGPEGKVYGIVGDKYYQFSPDRREVLFVGDLPEKGIRCDWLYKTPPAPEDFLYGIQGEVIFAIDPQTNRVRVVGRHRSLAQVG